MSSAELSDNGRLAALRKRQMRTDRPRDCRLRLGHLAGLRRGEYALGTAVIWDGVVSAADRKNANKLLTGDPERFDINQHMESVCD
jgi:hypothetical protein